MAIKKITYKKVGVPNFRFPVSRTGKKHLSLYNLSSHARAREALELFLKIEDMGFGLFVVGDDGSARLRETLNYLHIHRKHMLPPRDWLYANNFKNLRHSLALSLPAGEGKFLSERLQRMVSYLFLEIPQILYSPILKGKLKAEKDFVTSSIQSEFTKIRALALQSNLDLEEKEEGFIDIIPSTKKEDLTPDQFALNRNSFFININDSSESMQQEETEYNQILARKNIKKLLHKLNIQAQEQAIALEERLEKIKRQAIEKILMPYIERIKKQYEKHVTVIQWLEDLQEDILNNYYLFEDVKTVSKEDILERYTAHPLVSHNKEKDVPIILEPNPTYENMFGGIQYKATKYGHETSVHFIYPGSLHRANGGILVIRAESLAQHPKTWEFLKIALRDQVIRIEEQTHNTTILPMVNRPVPDPIPLKLKVVIIGDPAWYQAFLFADRAFQNFFKIKAEIDREVVATEENLSLYAKIIAENFFKKTKCLCSPEAIAYAFGISCRWTGHRERPSTQCDTLEEILYEAHFYRSKQQEKLLPKHILKMIEAKEHRSGYIKHKVYTAFLEEITNIETTGCRIGKITALTVQTASTERFGAPACITARTYMGRKGVINIEHSVDLAGATQHKGVLGIEGFLRGQFAQEFPISFSASITFEQNYMNVDGDSASLAALCAILSSLAQQPIHQSIALTGSVDQYGNVQAIGGINEKIEGFFYLCKERGLTGEQGIIFPKSNETSIILFPEIEEAIQDNKFHLWSVTTVDEAISLLMKIPGGILSSLLSLEGKETLYKKVRETLLHYDQNLKQRPYEDL